MTQKLGRADIHYDLLKAQSVNQAPVGSSSGSASPGGASGDVQTNNGSGGFAGSPPTGLSRTNDTNVTVTLGGTPATALLQAVSLTLGWTGTLSPARGGTGVNNATRTLTINTNNAILDYSGAYTLTVAGNASISGTNTGDQTLPIGANPTGTVGLTAVTGVLATFMRSDATPPLSQAIAPTMTGNWIWTPSANSTSSARWNDQSGSVILNIDATNKRIGILTASPAYALDVNGSARIPYSNFLYLTCNPGRTNSDISLNNPSNNDNFGLMGVYPPTGTDVGSTLAIIPRGAGFNSATKSQINLFNTDYVADNGNYEALIITAGGSEYIFRSGKLGTGSYRPIDFYTNGTSGQLYLATNGNVGIASTLVGAGVTYQILNVNGSQLFVGADSVQESPMFQIVSSYPTNTHASYKARAVLSVWDAGGAREAIRFESNGSASMIGLYGGAAVAQATTAVAASTFVANTSGIANDTATFDGYTLGQVVKALRLIGILA